MLYEILQQHISTINEMIGKPEFVLKKREDMSRIEQILYVSVILHRIDAPEESHMVISDSYTWPAAQEVTDYNEQLENLTNKCCGIMLLCLVNNGLTRYLQQKKRIELEVAARKNPIDENQHP